MKKTVLRYGLLSGAFMFLSMLIAFVFFKDESWAMTEYFGFGSMILVFVIMYFGIREHKVKNLGGTISFKQAFLTGLYITIICSLIYTITWMFISYRDPEMVENMLDTYYIPRDGELSADKLKEVADLKASYNNPVIRFGMTLMEIFPVGLLFTLIYAAINTYLPRK